MFVTYSGDDNNRFDREYRANAHLALILECWGPHGLIAASAFFPQAKTGNGLLSIGVYDFHDEHSVQAALAAPETDKVMADVTNFTCTTNIERSV